MEKHAAAERERELERASRRQVKINKAVRDLDTLLYRMGGEETELKKFARQIQDGLRK